MSKLNKVATPLALAFALAASPVALSAQEPVAPADPTVPADPAVPTDPTAPNPQSPTNMAPQPQQPGTTPVAPSQTPAPRADATQPGSSAQVTAFVDQQFPQADADGDGSLSATEFEPWIAKLKAAELQSSGQPVNEGEIQTYASNAFASADADANKLVTKAELAQFLSQA